MCNLDGAMTVVLAWGVHGLRPNQEDSFDKLVISIHMSNMADER